MIRVLFGAALPVIGIGLAVAAIEPNLFAGVRGEPLIMAASDEASLQAATFDGKACPSALLFAGPAAAGAASAFAGTHIVAFALRSGEKDVAVGVEDFPGATGAAKTVVLLFDDAGHLVAAGDPASLHIAAGTGADCSTAPDSNSSAPI